MWSYLFSGHGIGMCASVNQSPNISMVLSSMPLPLGIHYQITNCATNIIEELLSLLVELTAHSLWLARHQPELYHTSKITGHKWVLELITGHHHWIHHELHVKKKVFLCLIQELHRGGHRSSREVTLEEQLAIFLYTCGQAFPTLQWYNITVSTQCLSTSSYWSIWQVL